MNHAFTPFELQTLTGCAPSPACPRDVFAPFEPHTVTEQPVHEAGPGQRISLVLASALKAVARAAELVAEWQARSRARRELMALDERSLQDIGLSRGDAYMEYSKPFWRD
jgi:uncharacterized protein YjiS (DUF1127 family)